MQTDLRTPVGAHLRRTIEATPQPERRVGPGGGVVIGLLLSVPIWALLAGLGVGLHAAGLVMP